MQDPSTPPVKKTEGHRRSRRFDGLAAKLTALWLAALGAAILWGGKVIIALLLAVGVAAVLCAWILAYRD